MSAKVQEGYTDIQLTRPVNMGGVEVKALRMREPTVADQLASEAATGSDSAKEIAMIANLCQQAPDDIKQLTLRDYKKVQAAFLAFLA